jgi:hypothetical protein
VYTEYVSSAIFVSGSHWGSNSQSFLKSSYYHIRSLLRESGLYAFHLYVGRQSFAVKEFWNLVIFIICVTITVAMAMHLMDFGPYRIKLKSTCVYYTGCFPES